MRILRLIFSEPDYRCQRLSLQAQLFCLLLLVLSGEVIGGGSWNNPATADADNVVESQHNDDLVQLKKLGQLGHEAESSEGMDIRKQLMMTRSSSSDVLPSASTTSIRPQPRLLQQGQWCVAKAGQANSALQGALDWTCGPLEGQGQVDCSPIQSTGICYLPNTLQDHCSWAFNEYYQEHITGADSCDFGGNAVITTINPSTATCTYSGSGVSGNSSTGSFNSTTGGGSSDTSNANFNIQQQPSFRIAVVVAIAYFLSGQAF